MAQRCGGDLVTQTGILRPMADDPIRRAGRRAATEAVLAATALIAGISQAMSGEGWRITLSSVCTGLLCVWTVGSAVALARETAHRKLLEKDLHAVIRSKWEANT